MDNSDGGKIQVDKNTDWEEAFSRYESVIASGSESMQSVQEAAAYCLKQIACQGDGALAAEIGQSGVTNSILSLLPQSNNRFRKVLIKCVWCLVNFGNVNRLIVARNGGLEIVIDMLNSCRDGDRLYLLEILSALTLLREVRRVLVRLGGLRFLVEAVRFGSMISRERACQAIGLLGVTRRARSMLVELGAIQVLVELFRDGDRTTKLVAGNCLGVISAHIDFVRPLAEAGAIPLYAELLQGPDPAGMEIAEDAFCILAVAEENAASIAEHLVRILREGDDEAKIAASDIIWDLSEEMKDNAAEALVNFGEDPRQRDIILEAVDITSFQGMQNRMARLRFSDERIVRSLRRVNQQLIGTQF
ncbi:hypothetical protein GH714_007058 [Hevea brasiliensis]|uniref:Armadillo repeat-containing domain-containing protein n=1 Tax=Hevea brasiliensis TaxID=3981 RepID=A0A6A6KA52_HEVBR|nr:hypothetical protein GH714_007058 [Hevea brasiliensis]